MHPRIIARGPAVRVLLTVLAAVLYALGWAAGKVWVVLAWLGTAVLVGWRDATRPKAPRRVPEKVQVPAYPVPTPPSVPNPGIPERGRRVA
jgi:hypothetical protein